MPGYQRWVNLIQIAVLGILCGGLLESSGWLPRYGGWGAGAVLTVLFMLFTARRR